MNTILILDDESGVRQSFADYFEDQLWEVIQAASAEEALDLTADRTIQAAVVDMRLPGMDGNDFIRAMYQRGHRAAFVICTGSPEYTIPDDLLPLPCVCSQIVTKPVYRFEDLQELVLQTMEELADET
ncbi:response regulator [Desulfogranum japonicum]|uniref:response regulator n=1 Tax=Desulfogranum japonicum TaxID=231447 RepID=UPI0004141764|nr:response regulator [Desulfogranum japonicum]